MSRRLTSSLRLGREALAAADWERARAFFEQAAEFGESAEILDGLGEALQFGGEHARAIEVKERAFAEYERRGLRAEAAELARWLAFLHVSVHGNVAAANGWMARAESLLEGVEECAAHGWLMLDRAPWTSDASEREQFATAAIAIARRYGDRDLEFDAMALLGEAYVAAGRVTEGMTLLDQAMAAVASGEVVGVGPAGEIYCRLLSACERATDVRRAEQWLAAATRFEAWGDFVPPTCRTHYGGILIALGRWEEAERELLAAIRTFETGYWASQLFALLRLADLRVRQGRFEEAERLLEGFDWHASAKRSLARIALARGDLALAGDLGRLCLESTPPSDPDCAPVLALLVEVQLARGDLAAAEETLDQLAVLAARPQRRPDARRRQARRGHGPSRSRRRASAGGLPGGPGAVLGARSCPRSRAGPGRARTGARARTRRQRQSWRRGTRWRRSSVSARPGMPTRPPPCSESSGPPARTFPKGYGPLTKRETEVLSLLAEGCSNAEIAQRLYISRRTAEHHVARILAKLGLRNRAEAAAYALREQTRKSVAG